MSDICKKSNNVFYWKQILLKILGEKMINISFISCILLEHTQCVVAYSMYYLPALHTWGTEK